MSVEEIEYQEGQDDVQFLHERWQKLLMHLKNNFGKEPDIEGIIFLIGLRELGKTPPKLTKEVKVDLMHIAICALLAPSGYYELEYHDQGGWPHWQQSKELPFIDVFSQEIFLKSHIVDYFKDIYDI